MIRALLPRLAVASVGSLLLMAVYALGGWAFHAPIHDLSVTPADFTVLGAESTDGLGNADSVAMGDLNGDSKADLIQRIRTTRSATGVVAGDHL